MTRRSHEIASRQAEVARERKRKKKLQISRPASSAAATKVASESGAAAPFSSDADTVIGSSPTQSAGPIKTEDTQYRYVKSDLKLIAIIGVPIVIVLIVLAIVL